MYIINIKVRISQCEHYTLVWGGQGKNELLICHTRSPALPAMSAFGQMVTSLSFADRVGPMEEVSTHVDSIHWV